MPSPLTPAEARELALRVSRQMEDQRMTEPCDWDVRMWEHKAEEARMCEQCAWFNQQLAAANAEIARLHEVIAGAEVEAWRDNYPSIRYYEVQIDKSDYRRSREFLDARKEQG